MLPPDLLLEILEKYVDLQSLFRLRYVNEVILEAIQSLPKYQRAITYAPMTLWALIRTGFAQDITLNNFHIELCSNLCLLCGKYGSYLSLPLRLRCCYNCILHRWETQLRRVDHVKRFYQMGKAEMAQVRKVPPLPERYAGSRARMELLAAAHVLMSPFQAHVVCSKSNPNIRRFPLDMGVGMVRQCTINLAGCCAFPWYNKKTGTAESGVSCLACSYFLNHAIGIARCDEEREVFTHEEFLNHFKWCMGAQSYWAAHQRPERQQQQIELEREAQLERQRRQRRREQRQR